MDESGTMLAESQLQLAVSDRLAGQCAPPALWKTRGPSLPSCPAGAARLPHGKPWRWRGTRQPTTREGKVGPDRVAERPVIPGKPGNAGGGKGPQVEAMAKESRLTTGVRSTRSNVGRHHMHKRRGRPDGRRRQGVNRPDDAPAGQRKSASLVPRLAIPNHSP